MQKLTLTMPNGRIINIVNLSTLQIDFYRKFGLYALKYSDDFCKEALICSHESWFQIFHVYKIISNAYSEGTTSIVF